MTDIVPVIDFSAYSLDRDEPDEDSYQALIDDVHKALSTFGCMYVKKHGISPEKVL